MPLDTLLRDLVTRHDATNVLGESGAGLLGELFRQKLVQAAWVFIAPMLLGDEHAAGALRGLHVDQLTEATPLRRVHQRRRGDDLILRYRVG